MDETNDEVQRHFHFGVKVVGPAEKVNQAIDALDRHHELLGDMHALMRCADDVNQAQQPLSTALDRLEKAVVDHRHRWDDADPMKRVANALGGGTLDTGGGIVLAIFPRRDGKVVAISEDAVCLYGSEDALNAGSESVSILLR